MEVEFEKSRNDLLKRTNVLVKIRSAKTPSKKELQTKVASILACDESLVVVDKISQEFGSKISNAYVKIYDDVVSLKNIELEHNIRDLLKKEKEKEDALKAERKAKKEAKLNAAKEKEAPFKDATEEVVKEEASKEVKEDSPLKEASKEVKEDSPLKEDVKEEK